ncbi:MAG: nucleotide exchange factor GrpE [Oscillospiraceae bacterium]|nr:nucleotide exchange factor GrpE [Oscillospiraceae bacterium]
MINDIDQEELREDAADTVTDDAQTAEDSAAENSTAEDEAAKVSDELAAVKDQLLRTMAEYDNFRKRSAREKDALRADIITNVTSKFLPVMDNLERALNAECSDENYKNGVKMIYDSFMETLKGLGVEEIESDGAVFDPNLHQAVQRVSEGDAESGTVVQTFAKGYKIGDKVIRFAVVAVKE